MVAIGFPEIFEEIELIVITVAQRVTTIEDFYHA